MCLPSSGPELFTRGAPGGPQKCVYQAPRPNCLPGASSPGLPLEGSRFRPPTVPNSDKTVPKTKLTTKWAQSYAIATILMLSGIVFRKESVSGIPGPDF